jgi:hypothetical protein
MANRGEENAMYVAVVEPSVKFRFMTIRDHADASVEVIRMG